MMKFFRKHNKKLLAIFGVLLMIVFVGGSALDNLLQPSTDRVIATSRVGQISFRDLRIAENTTDILSRIGLNWKLPFGGMTEPLDTPDWVLLKREAEAIGMDAAPETMRSALGAESDMYELARRLKVRPDHILAAMAELTSIKQAARAVAGVSRPSEAELRTAVRDALAKVRVGVVVLPAKAFVDEEETFTEAELEAQFAAYREREAGPGLNFGYYVQPAVQAQFIKIDKAAIAEVMRKTKPEYLEQKAKEFYDLNRETDRVFLRPPEEKPATEEGEDDAGPEQPPYLTWEEAGQMAVDKILEQEAKQATARVADWLIQHMTERWLEVTREETGYKKAPEATARLEYYNEIVDILPKTIAYPGTVTVATTDFFNRDEAPDLPILGKASFHPEGGLARSLRELAFLTELIVSPINFDGETDWMDYTATFQTCRFPLTDPDGNMYVFRIIDSQPGHVPESVDEVRNRVVTDLRLKSGYQLAKDHGDSLLTCANGGGLQEAFKGDDELVSLEGAAADIGVSGLGFFEPTPFTRSNQWDIMRGEKPEKRYLGREIGPVPTEIVDRFFALEDAPERIALVELDERATILVVEWLETQMAQYDEFMEKRERFAQQMTSSRTQTSIQNWLDPEQIRARNEFMVVQD